MYNHDPFALNPYEFISRLQACATLTLGYRPSSHQITTAIIKHVMKDRKTDSASMLSLADELFSVPVSEQEVI